MSSRATITPAARLAVGACAKSICASVMASRNPFNARPSGRLAEIAPGSLANQPIATSITVPTAIWNALAVPPFWVLSH